MLLLCHPKPFRVLQALLMPSDPLVKSPMVFLRFADASRLHTENEAPAYRQLPECCSSIGSMLKSEHKRVTCADVSVLKFLSPAAGPSALQLGKQSLCKQRSAVMSSCI